MAKSKDTSTVKALVLVDSYGYLTYDDNGNVNGRVDVPDQASDGSAKGTEIEVTAAEFERATKMTPPALAKVGSPEAKRFLGQESLPDRNFNDLSDEDLAAIVQSRGGSPDDMNRDELLGFVVGTPGNPSSNPAKT